MKKWVCRLAGGWTDKQVGGWMGGRQGPDFGIVSRGHSLCNSTHARAMTQHERFTELQGPRSLQPAGRARGPLGHDSERQMDVASQALQGDCGTALNVRMSPSCEMGA